MSKRVYSACKGDLLLPVELHNRAGSWTIVFHCRLKRTNETFSRQIETLSTCRYAHGMSTVAIFIQTLLCDCWLASRLACFMPFSHTSIFYSWVVLVELLYYYFFPALWVRIRLCMAPSFGLAQTWIKLIKIQNADEIHFKCKEFELRKNPRHVMCNPWK